MKYFSRSMDFCANVLMFHCGWWQTSRHLISCTNGPVPMPKSGGRPILNTIHWARSVVSALTASRIATEWPASAPNMVRNALVVPLLVAERSVGWRNWTRLDGMAGKRVVGWAASPFSRGLLLIDLDIELCRSEHHGIEPAVIEQQVGHYLLSHTAVLFKIFIFMFECCRRSYVCAMVARTVFLPNSNRTIWSPALQSKSHWFIAYFFNVKIIIMIYQVILPFQRQHLRYW